MFRTELRTTLPYIKTNDRLKPYLNRATEEGYEALLMSWGFNAEDIRAGYQQFVIPAIQHNALDLLRWLVYEKGCSLDLKDKDGNDIILFAAKLGHVDILKWLVEEKKCLLNLSEIGIDALFTSIEHGQLESLKWLVDVRGLLLNVKNKSKQTPLIWAILHDQLDILKYLDERNCLPDFNEQDQCAHSILISAIQNGYLRIVQWLVTEKKYLLSNKELKADALFTAIREGNTDFLQWLLATGNAPLDSIDNNGDSPVILAIKRGRLEILKLLIAKDCSLTFVDLHGNNAVLIAAKYCQLEILKWLVDEKKISLEVKNNNQMTPVFCAATSEEYEQQLETLKWLIDIKHCSLKDRHGRTPLLCIANRSPNPHKLEIVKWLVMEKACSVYEKDLFDNNIILIAADKGDLGLIKWAVERKLNLTYVNKQKVNMILIAAMHDHLHIMQWAVDIMHCSLNCIDIYGMNTLQFAANTLSFKVLKWLIDVKGLSLSHPDQMSLVARAINHGRLDILKWLALNGSNIHISNLGCLQRQPTVSADDYLNILKWYVNENNGSVGLKDLAYTYFTPEESIYLLSFIKDSSNKIINFMQKNLSRWKYQSKNTQHLLNTYLENIISEAYLKSEESLTPDPTYLAFLKFYTSIAPLSALKFQITFLSNMQRVSELLEICVDALSSTSIHCQSLAKYTLTEWLLREDFLKEEGSPLEIDENTSFSSENQQHILNADNGRLRRYIQAEYLLRDCSTPEALRIKKILEKFLCQTENSSQHTTLAPNPNACWTPEALHYSAAYDIFKQSGPGMRLTQFLSTHYVPITSHTCVSPASSSANRNGIFYARQPEFSDYANDVLNSSQYLFVMTCNNTTVTICVSGEGMKKSLKFAILGELSGHIQYAMRKHGVDIRWLDSGLAVQMKTAEDRDLLVALLVKRNIRLIIPEVGPSLSSFNLS